MRRPRTPLLTHTHMLQVWDLSAPPGANPLRSLEEHTHEVYCVAWNLARRNTFLSASWDDTAKLWSLDAPRALRTFAEHAYCVYAAAWNPAAAEVFATASGDCTVKIWDARQPFSTMTIPAHQYEILSVDWNKYNDCVIATGSVDKTARLWVRACACRVCVRGGALTQRVCASASAGCA
jgi:peroxin-7